VKSGLFRWFTPCFVLRPEIFIRACWRKARKRPEHCVVKTAWGDWLKIDPRKFIGANVYMRGVHELPVCEALWRLAAPGETVADVGANIGVMTSVLSRKVGQTGRVIAFEPHPEVLRQLEHNVQRWRPRRVEIVNKAVSSHAGNSRIKEEECFAVNEGTARVVNYDAEERTFDVDSIRLDEALPGDSCRVIKIDVEGHEFDVLSGALRLLASGNVRDIVLESTWEYPSSALELLLKHRYQIFDLRASFLGPLLKRPEKRTARSGKVSDYVATLDAERANRLFSPAGWQLLGAG
jgi:FkbM family methyltransferase